MSIPIDDTLQARNNANFSLIYGALGIQSFAYSSFPAANLYLPGTLLAASDRGYALYVSNGSVWSPAASGSSLPSQAGHAGQYLTTDGTNASWAAISLSLGGDLAGSLGAATVTGIQGHAVAATAMTDQQVLWWSQASSELLPHTLVATDVGAVATTRQILAGTGLVGGGTLTSDVTISMPNVGPGAVTTGGGGAYIASITTDAQGRIASLTAATPSAANGLDGAYIAGNSSQNIIGLSSAAGSVLIRDNATPLGSTLFGVQDATGTIKYLDVQPTGTSVRNTLTIDTATSGYPAIVLQQDTATAGSISELSYNGVYVSTLTIPYVIQLHGGTPGAQITSTTATSPVLAVLPQVDSFNAPALVVQNDTNPGPLSNLTNWQDSNANIVASIGKFGSITSTGGLSVNTSSRPNGVFVGTANAIYSTSYTPAIVLNSGTVLLAGGVVGSETFNESTGFARTTGGFPHSTFGIGTEAVLLSNGQVLYTNGYYNGITVFNFAALYDPIANRFSSTGNTVSLRRFTTLNLLPNGNVLAAGGDSAASGTSSPLVSAEIYNTTAGTFALTGLMATAREYHTGTTFTSGPKSGLVLIAGGLTAGGVTTATAELYDYNAGTFAATGSMVVARQEHTATLLPSGKVLIVGGSNGSYLASAELYDPSTGTFSATGSMMTARADHTATLLPNGTVLLAGGQNSGGYLASTEIYDPTAGTFSAGPALNTARAFHSASLLPSGNVLVVNGYNGSGNLSNAEIYYYAQAPAATITAPANATEPVLLVKGGATPGINGDLQQWQNSTAAVVAKIDATGNLSVQSFQNLSASNEVTTASAGTNGALPSQVKGYLVITLHDGSTAKLPYYAA